MHVADFLAQVLKLAACSHDVVQQVPYLCLEEVLSETVSVKDFSLENELIVIVAELNAKGCTLTMPLEPHIPTDSKECFEGSRMTSLLSESLTWFMLLTHSL